MTRLPGNSPAAAGRRRHVTGRGLHPGQASGPLLRLAEPVSFWGGVSAEGYVIDSHHPQRGQSVSASVLAMTAGRGSSSASSVLAEQIRAGTAPAAIILTQPDVIIVLGAVVAAELYGRMMPILQISPADYAALPAAGWAVVDVAAAAPGRDSGGMSESADTAASLVVTAE